MKSTPIIFSTEMVRAILDGQKTQTRRIVKGDPYLWLFNETPFGKVGDQLWVRETWAYGNDDLLFIYKAGYPKNSPYQLKNTPSVSNVKWKPSIHMPFVVCRIFLEITDTRIERLQDITPDDAMDEGIPLTTNDPIEEFCFLWESIYGPGSWDANPYVWVISFKAKVWQ
ncbi:MAG: hypothetical protein HUU10_04295 [Bacteroidetes bacterium]|nr:hypothetical protein [Bacteroidota bacterium]